MTFEDSDGPACAALDGIEISTDPDRIDTDLVHDFLSRQTDWAAGIPRGTLERSIHNSLVFGAYTLDGQQVGFARAVTDCATFAHIMDMFVLPQWRRQGLGKRLIEAILAHPKLQDLRRWSLATRDRHGLYSRYGFTRLAEPELFMELCPRRR
ncbi:MAG TPA: GNAT family N-acetyltransferase [Alphaproteobacteria bacterium]|nr:GNAT family N-acetyltransferase [Alphaproteobacteria bacterium]